MAKALEQCRSGKDFVRLAQTSPNLKEQRQSGSHVILQTPNGEAVVPVHPGDLGKGLRCKLVKAFVAIGLALIPLSCLLASLYLYNPPA